MACLCHWPLTIAKRHQARELADFYRFVFQYQKQNDVLSRGRLRQLANGCCRIGSRRLGILLSGGDFEVDHTTLFRHHTREG